MKIILKILAFIFLLNVNAHSELIYLTQCYVTDFKSSDGKIEKKVFKSPAEDESKNTDKKDQTYTLNTDTETITKTLINSDQKMLEYFDILDQIDLSSEEIVSQEKTLDELRKDEFIPYDKKLIESLKNFRELYVQAPKMN